VSLANLYYNIGNLRLELNSSRADPLESFERARVIQELLVRDHPSVTEYQAALAKTHGNIGTIHRIGSRWAQARASLERTRDILQILARDHPAVTAYRSDLGLTYYNLGILQVATGQADLATSGFQRARDLLETLVRSDPERLAMRHLLGAIWHELAAQYVAAGRRQDGLDAYQRAIAHQSLPFAKALRGTGFRQDVEQAFVDHYVGLARVQADLGRYVEALGSFERAHMILESRSAVGPNDLYDLACIRSECSRLAGESPGDFTTAEQARCRAFTDQAIDALRRAVSAGFWDRARLNKDRALDPLRARTDFQSLLMDLDFPANPFVK
jgi:tetratricopeptide (TPR) repeat protein